MIEQPTEDRVSEKGKEWLVSSLMDLTICAHSLHSESEFPTFRSLLKNLEMCHKFGAKQTLTRCGMKERWFVVSQSLSTFNSSSSTGTPPYRRPTQPDFQETWEKGGSGEVMKTFETTKHHHE